MVCTEANASNALPSIPARQRGFFAVASIVALTLRARWPHYLAAVNHSGRRSAKTRILSGTVPSTLRAHAAQVNTRAISNTIMDTITNRLARVPESQRDAQALAQAQPATPAQPWVRSRTTPYSYLFKLINLASFTIEIGRAIWHTSRSHVTWVPGERPP